MKRFLMVALATVACGSDKTATPEEKLQGTWGVMDSTTECVDAWVFDGDTLESDEICTLEDGSTAIQASLGTYQVSGSHVTWTITSSTCADEDHEKMFSFDFVGDRLRAADTGAVLLFDRIPDKSKSSGGSGAAKLGCFDADGVFTDSPITKL